MCIVPSYTVCFALLGVEQSVGSAGEDTVTTCGWVSDMESPKITTEVYSCALASDVMQVKKSNNRRVRSRGWSAAVLSDLARCVRLEGGVPSAGFAYLQDWRVNRIMGSQCFWGLKNMARIRQIFQYSVADVNSGNLKCLLLNLFVKTRRRASLLRLEPEHSLTRRCRFASHLEGSPRVTSYVFLDSFIPKRSSSTERTVP